LIWYDCREVNWTPSTLEDIVEDMGYEVEGGIKIYCCIPILASERNGLRQIRTELDGDLEENKLG
jgi:hypothetical protein